MLRVACCLQRWMLCTLRIRVPTRVLALPVLWPWTESIDLGVPLREHNRSRGSLRNTYLRLVLGPLLSPSSRLLFLLYVTLPPYLRTTSILFDDTREIYLESICGYVNDVRNVISVLSHLSPMADEAGQSLFLYRPIYRSIKLTVRNYCMVGRGGYFYSVNVIVTERLRKVKGRGGRLLRKGYQIWVISAKNSGNCVNELNLFPSIRMDIRVCVNTFSEIEYNFVWPIYLDRVPGTEGRRSVSGGAVKKQY